MALVAFEGLLAGVGADVALEQPGPAEGLAAYFALAGQRVGAHVHLERAHRLVLLAAVLAAKVVVLVADDLERLRLEYGLLHLGLLLLHACVLVELAQGRGGEVVPLDQVERVVVVRHRVGELVVQVAVVVAVMSSVV